MTSSIDFQRFITVYHTDYVGTVPAAFNPHASLQEVAQALCDDEIADCPVVRIIECNPSEGWSRDVTEDVARLVPDIVERREGWTIRDCADKLMRRYGLTAAEDSCDDCADQAYGDLMQVGFDEARHQRAMEGARQ